MERWKPIPDFPGYSVSDRGRVLNEDTQRIMAVLVNQQGVAYVGLTRDKVQYRRGLALLVANEFLDPPPASIFDTPIHLDGDKTNADVRNLAWRPRWFAVKYHKQFKHPPKGFRVPIQDVETGTIFETSWEAAITYGLLDEEILSSIVNLTYVWPTYQKFRVLD